MKQLAGRLYSVAAPEQPGAPEQFFAALHGLLRPALRRMTEGQPWVSLELGGSNGQARFYIWIPLGQEPFIEDLLRAAYPGVELHAVDDDPLAQSTQGHVAFAPVTLSRSTYLPINTAFDGDALAPLLSVLGRPGDNERIHISLLVRPRANGWQTSARSEAHRLRKGTRSMLAEALLPTPKAKPAPTPHHLEQAKLIEEKATSLGFDCALRIYAVGRDEIAANEYLRAVAAALRPFDGANSFAFPRVWRRDRGLEELRTRNFPGWGSFILNTKELTLWHLPAVAPPHVEAVRSPKLPAPHDVPSEGRVLGVSTYAGHERPVALSHADARRHLAILGPTGSGKSTLLINLALQDLLAGKSLVVLDPKGDLVEGILARLPQQRMNDVVLIAPDEADSSIGLNPLEWTDPADRDLIADNVTSIFRRVFAQSWGPRTDDILKSSLLTLLQRPDATLCQIPPLLTDPAFRARVVSLVEDPWLQMFWRWYEGLSEAQRSEVSAPLANKLREFFLRPRIRRLVCQPRSTVDLKGLLDGRGVLLVNLATGLWGDATASLLGSLIVARIWQEIRRRAAVPEEQRTDTSMIVDEWQHFVGVAQSFGDTLAEARSYRLALTLANQHLGQLPKDLKEAITSNARSRIVFQCGQDDARYLAREFAPLEAGALQALPRYEMAVRLSVDGETSRPFTARALAPAPVTDPGMAAHVAELSRSRFGRSSEVIDAELRTVLDPGMPAPSPHGVGRRPRS